MGQNHVFVEEGGAFILLYYGQYKKIPYLDENFAAYSIPVSLCVHFLTVANNPLKQRIHLILTSPLKVTKCTSKSIVGLLKHFKDEYKDRLKQKHDIVRDGVRGTKDFNQMKKDCDKSLN